MVSELGGGQPPSPTASQPFGALLDAHPAGTATLPAPAAAQPCTPAALALPTAADAGTDQPHDGFAAVEEGGPASRSVSPAPSCGVSAGPAPAAPTQQPQHPSGFVPLSELGGGSGPPTAAVSQQQQQHMSACPGSSDEEPSSRALDRPASAAGYESGDDMEPLSMQHCINCTGTLWGHICVDCGHMPAHDADIFSPTPVSAAALHRPRLQGDALTVLCWDERMELHEESGSGAHPERPDRVRAVMARLRAAELAARCRRLPAREATPAEVAACHVPELLEAVDLLSERARLGGDAGLHVSPDTYVNQHTALCAKLSAGACVDVAAAVARGEARAGVAVVRPPGHHAESNTAMGFCFFNNAGIAARAAQAAGAGRVLVLDWDVHHGNGTQHIFEADPSVLYMSLHRHDGGSFYPGTGAAHEVGEGAGEGFTVNVAWPCGGMRNGDYLAAFHHAVLPIAYEYGPDLIIISAGFDAAEGDPIGGCHLTPECFAHMAAQLQLVAPTVALLEGGYNLQSTARGTEAVVRVLLGERPPPLPASEQAPCEYAMAAIAQVMRIQSRYWECMRGLVQQQFKVLAAAAARQEQLAAMQLRRGEAGGGSRDLAVAEDEAMCEADGEEEEGCGLQQRLHHRHRVLLAGVEGPEETEADTPHQEYRGGSGWDSDADLSSDEGLSRGGCDSGAFASPQRQHSDQLLGALADDADDGALAIGATHGYGSDASPLRLGVVGSDTLPTSDVEAPGSGASSDGSLQQPAGLAAGSLSPPGSGAPAVEQRREASASPRRERSPAADGGAAWHGLAVRPVLLKRGGQTAHQRLSPALVDDAALQLVQQQAPPPSQECAAPHPVQAP